MISKVAGCKKKLKTRTITEKYKILKEVDKGESSAFISKKYDIAKQALSGWLKGKINIYSEVEKNKTSVKSVRMRLFPYEDLEKAYYMWLLNARCDTKTFLCAEPFSKSKFVFCKKNLGVTFFKHPIGG